MKRALLVVLLLGLVLAGSALEKSRLNHVVVGNPVTLNTEYSNIFVSVNVDARAKFNVYNLTLKFIGEQKLQSEKDSISIDLIKQERAEGINWKIKTTSPGTYDLSNAFEIVSWDDSVALQLDEVPEQTSEQTIELRGWTDSASLCEKHNYSGFWGERENCQVKVVVNNEEYWAERSGIFVVEYELEEGENRIDIRAQDPGGNTEEKVLMVTYNPSVVTILEQNIIPVVVVLVLVIAGFVGLIVYWRGRKASREDIISETLEELREKQGRLFMDYARRTAAKGGYDKQTGQLLIETFQQIIKKDMYYDQSFADVRMAIKERETIFRDDRVSPGVRDLLLQQYVKILQDKRH